MIFRSADPVNDFRRYDSELADNEKKYPVCDHCGERITDEKYWEIIIGLKIKRFHEDCIEVSQQYTSDYIEEKGYFQ